MRRLVVLAVPAAIAACGGSPKPAPKPEQPRPPPHATRVLIEDDSQDGDTEDGVTFVTKHGHMPDGAIDDGLAPHTTALSECFTKKAGRRRYLGGEVQLHWDIKADGTVSAVKLTASDLGAWDIERCLLDEAGTAEFGKPVGGETDFMIPLSFAMKGSAAAWDEDRTLAAVGGQLAELDECAVPKPVTRPVPRPVTKRTPAPKEVPEVPLDRLHEQRNHLPAPTNVTITLYVGPHGKVQSVGFSSPTSGISDGWAECAQKTVMAWRLPDPQGQIAKLAIRYKPE